MRIAHVTPVYPPHRAGMGQVAEEYATRLRSRGHDIVVIAPAGNPLASQPSWVHFVPALIRVGNASLLARFTAVLRTCQIVHLHYPFFGAAEQILAARAAQTLPPIVVTYHMDAVGAGLKGRLFQTYTRWCLPQLVRLTSRILVSTRTYAESSDLASIQDAFNVIDVHPFGVDCVRFSPGQEPELRAELQIAKNEVVVVFVGRLDAAHAFKGLEVLFEALARVSAIPWRLIVVGDGDRKPRLTSRAERLGIAARTVFVGQVSSALLPRYYRAADVHVLPSTTRSEAFGLVTLEAAASGIPSVVSDLPGVRENVLEGQTGLIVPPRDASALGSALQSLLCSPERRRALGAAARVRAAARCQWDPMIDRLEAVYREVLLSHRHGDWPGSPPVMRSSAP